MHVNGRRPIYHTEHLSTARCAWVNTLRGSVWYLFICRTLCAVYSMVLCLSVIGRSSIKTAERIELLISTEATLIPFHECHVACHEGIRVSSTITVLFGTLSQTLNLSSVFLVTTRRLPQVLWTAFDQRPSPSWAFTLKLIHTACQTRQNCLVCRCDLDSSRQLKTVADRKFEAWTR